MRRKAPNTKDFHIYLPKPLADMLQDVAAGNQRSVSQQITVWIERELAQLARLKRYTSQGK